MEKKLALIIHPAKYDTIEEPCRRMCRTCAYRKPVLTEEMEMEREFWVERGRQPHSCHEDITHYCRGSWEFTKSLGLHDGNLRKNEAPP